MEDVQQRFWKFVDRSGDASCWEWTGQRDRNGYGRFCAGGRRRRSQLAHRIAYEILTGSIPAGLCVLHRCDNPGCVNPSHLFIGTKRDNNHDAMSKGRIAHGVDHHEAKLTPERVREIRGRYTGRGGPSYRSLAGEYGVSESVIRSVVARRSWRHVTP